MDDDVEPIKQLKARYFRLMDTKDWAGMRRLFIEDVRIDTTESRGGLVGSLDDFMDVLPELLGGATTVHQGHMPEPRGGTASGASHRRD